MFTDFFIAKICEAEAIAQSDVDKWKLLTLHGIAEMELIELSKTLRGGMHHRPALAFEDGESECYVLAMEPGLVSMLAGLSEPQIPDMAKEWSKAECFVGIPCTEIEPMLQSLVAFAQESERSELQILYVTAI